MSDPKRTWYLPLGVVRHPRKPDKVRVVWDAAATVNGVSLNSLLLPGPDLLTPLMTVLCQFRQRQYAVSADIRQMFHQPIIRQEDRQVQRFLYRTDVQSSPTVYVLDVATFGATCSPCSAQYAKNLNASEYRTSLPEAAEAVIKNTYVDDYLDSRDTIEEAVKLSLEVRMINSKAGFDLRNWKSNSKEILRHVGVECLESEKNFAVEKSTPMERVLGMSWMTDDDIFVFSAQFREDLQHVLSGNIVPTKRQVLRVVMSYFDPLGIITNYTIQGRILLQDIWRSNVKWDDPITDADFSNWQRWVMLAPQLNRVAISRCYFPNYEISSYDSLQLHVFVDAGDQAYGAVAYFRIVERGIPRCALVAAKAKVTSLKPLSTPRCELNASVIGVRLMKTIENNHSLRIKKRFLWTDSTTVLSWIRADPRKYRQYVALRVSEILSESHVSEWYWIATSKNVADKTTKWGHGPDFEPNSEWYSGPSFLLQPENEWTLKQPCIVDPPEELKVINVHQEASIDPVVDFAKFSQLQSLLRRLAYLHHFRRRCSIKQRVSSTKGKVVLSQEDFEAAERSLWKIIQLQEFPHEIFVLRRNAILPMNERVRLEKSSSLSKSSPFIDDDGILRVQSRIDPAAAYYAFNFRNPIILPKHNHVTDLLVLHYHQKFGHANVEIVVNELRQRYYITRLRTVVKKIVKQCMWCRVYRAVPHPPKMAALPQPRVQPYVRPFSFVGLDYFGPMIIKRGRTNIKRWVALFTCLTVRAVHLEVVHSLSTESCKMAIRRFIARRGAPREIFSDNGTNFRGAARDLAEEIRNINSKVASTFTNADTKWTFTPPSAPHMGGVWERKVRSIKEALKSLCHRDKLDDEEFCNRWFHKLPCDSITNKQESLTPEYNPVICSPCSEREIKTLTLTQSQPFPTVPLTNQHSMNSGLSAGKRSQPKQQSRGMARGRWYSRE
ncbi:uncharacterized protein LOC134288109 [Aedes albopictus]|uniref:Integrase catalytic domain-containing protein n=1 Tax=Aedes albopictus TaxID=7160 RepID=A0ABM1YX32_AEDAL